MNVMALCAGIGGLELGLHIAEPRIRPVVFVESDAFCRTVLAARWPGVPTWDDVLTFDGRPWAGGIDLVTAGFPCQPWSVAGKRLGTEDARWIWPEISAIIRDVAPLYVFLENVPALVTGGGLACVLGSLAELGFAAEWGVFDCESLGGSHRRRRVFILAYSQSLQRRQGWKAPAERQGRPLRSEQGLADSLCEQLGGQQVAGSQCPVPAQPAQHQTTVGHADGLRGRGHGLQEPRDPEAQGPSQRMEWGRLEDLAHRDCPPGRVLRERVPKTGRRSQVLADGDGERLSVRQEQHHQQLQAALGSCRALWAPGPDADWGGIPREWWPSELPVCGVADGLSGRMDHDRRKREFLAQPDRVSRLRALGNAVSPPAAAVAWRVLTHRLLNI